ncbi:hypothetical protein D3C75_1311990 [compost metagenome]
MVVAVIDIPLGFAGFALNVIPWHHIGPLQIQHKKLVVRFSYRVVGTADTVKIEGVLSQQTVVDRNDLRGWIDSIASQVSS